MELVELHVGHPAAGAPGHGDAVAGGAVRVAGVEIGLAGAARGQHHEAGAEQLHLLGVMVEDVGAHAPVPRQEQLAVGDQVHGHPVLEYVDVRLLSGAFTQGL